MCSNDYVFHACSVPSNQMGQPCVDIMLVTTSGIAESTAAAGGNSKNLWDGGEGKRWIKQSSNTQYLIFVSLLPMNVVLLMESSSITRASSQWSRSTRAYASGEPTSTWSTTSYRFSFDFVNLCNLWAMNFVNVIWTLWYACIDRGYLYEWM